MKYTHTKRERQTNRQPGRQIDMKDRAKQGDSCLKAAVEEERPTHVNICVELIVEVPSVVRGVTIFAL